MTISAFNDELAQVRTKKKEFLDQIERIVPWKEWLAMIQPCYLVFQISNVSLLISLRSFVLYFSTMNSTIGGFSHVNKINFFFIFCAVHIFIS